MKERLRIGRKIKKKELLTEKEQKLMNSKLKPKPFEKPKVNSILKCRIYPNQDTRAFFKKANGCSRYIYNKANAMIKEKQVKVDTEEIKNILLPEKNIEEDVGWQLETPKDIRLNAIKECVTAYKAAFSNLKNGNISHFNIGFKSKKKEKKISIEIPGSAVKLERQSISIYPSYIPEVIKLRKPENLAIYHGSAVKIIHYFKTNKWFVHIPVIRTNLKSTDNQGYPKYCFDDPGERTAITTIDTDGNGFAFGSGDMKTKMVPIFLKMDRINSLLDKPNSGLNKKQAKKLKCKLVKLSLKIKNRINDFHHKSAKFQLDHYDVIVRPDFGSKNMIQSNNLRKLVKRRLVCWSHYQGKRILLDKATKYTTGIIHTETEEYTTQTCICGQRKKQGGNERYRCGNKDCSYAAPRDLHGAMMIGIKSISK